MSSLLPEPSPPSLLAIIKCQSRPDQWCLSYMGNYNTALFHCWLLYSVNNESLTCELIHTNPALYYPEQVNYGWSWGEKAYCNDRCWKRHIYSLWTDLGRCDIYSGCSWEITGNNDTFPHNHIQQKRICKVHLTYTISIIQSLDEMSRKFPEQNSAVDDGFSCLCCLGKPFMIRIQLGETWP